MKPSARDQIRGKVVANRRGQTPAQVRSDGGGVVITLSIANEGSMISLLRSATRVSR